MSSIPFVSLPSTSPTGSTASTPYVTSTTSASRKHARDENGSDESPSNENVTKKPKLTHPTIPMPNTPSPSAITNSIATKSDDMRSMLKQAAMERAARRGGTPTSSAAPAVSSSSSSTPPLVPNTPSPVGSASTHAPSHLRLQIGSPHGIASGEIGTPVIYTGPGPSPLVRSTSAPSPLDELAGFDTTPSAFPSYKTPPSLPASTPASGASQGSRSRSAHVSQDGVACPLCARTFPSSIIETHAAECTGEAVRGEEIQFTDIAAPEPSPEAAAASLAPRSSTISCTPPTKPLPFFPRHHDRLVILTWNCWFDSLCMRQRMDAIGSVILAESPHVVALQEVTEDSLAMIKRSEWIQHYHVTERSFAPYFTLLCTKFQPESPRRLPFESQMGRDLLCMNIEVPTSIGTRRLSIATSHLESEHQRKEARRQQLEVALKLLRARKQNTRTACFVGDMNLVGKECSDIVSKYGWTDAWLSTHNYRGGDKEGVTIDTQANLMLASQPRQSKRAYQARLDRVWLRFGSGEKQPSATATTDAPAASSSSTPTPAPSTSPQWSLASIERIGMRSIDLRNPKSYGASNHRVLETPKEGSTTPTASSISTRRLHGFGLSPPQSDSSMIVFPSDHFGLMTTLEVVKPTAK